jgi:hypoxanthine-DNA glycosylase
VTAPPAPKRSFAPIVGPLPRALVLGTLPGEESLRRREYYAHPRNLFWPIVFALFGSTPPASYPARLDFVKSVKLALWDVCEAAHRDMSADSAIAEEIPNRIGRLLDLNPSIRTVAFNGSTARRLYLKHFRPRPGIAYLALPSTSPAHARLGFPQKLAQWQVLRTALVGECDRGKP